MFMKELSFESFTDYDNLEQCDEESVVVCLSLAYYVNIHEWVL